MSNRQDSLDNFFKTFNSTDNQGWCDIGYEISEGITQSYSDEEWLKFLNEIGALNEGVYLGVIEIMPLIPGKHHQRVIEELLVHANDEAWLEAFSIFNQILKNSPESAMLVFSKIDLLKSFETQFISWVNFNTKENEGFRSYYERYSHLISQDARECYESLCKSQNKYI